MGGSFHQSHVDSFPQPCFCPHPKVKIDIQAGGAGKGITDVLSKVTDIGLVSRELNPAEFKKGAFAIAVTPRLRVADALLH